MCKPNVYRIYKQETSRYVRKNGYQLVRCWGCNGREHRIQYFFLRYDSRGDVTDGKCNIRPDKVLGKCDHKCGNGGSFTKYDG